MKQEENSKSDSTKNEFKKVLGKCAICGRPGNHSLEGTFLEYDYCTKHYLKIEKNWKDVKYSQKRSFNFYPIYQWILLIIIVSLLWITWFGHTKLWHLWNLAILLPIMVGALAIFICCIPHSDPIYALPYLTKAKNETYDFIELKGREKKGIELKVLIIFIGIALGIFFGQLLYDYFSIEIIYTHNLSIFFIMYVYYRWNKYKVEKEYYEVFFARVVVPDDHRLRYGYKKHRIQRIHQEGDYEDPKYFTILSIITSFNFLLVYLLNEQLHWELVYLPGILEIIGIWFLMYGVNLPKIIFKKQIRNLRHTLASFFTGYAFFFRITIELVGFTTQGSGNVIMLPLFFLSTEVTPEYPFFVMIPVMIGFTLILLLLNVFRYQIRNDALATSRIKKRSDFEEVISVENKQALQFGIAMLSYPQFVVIIPLLFGMISGLFIVGIVTLMDLYLSRKHRKEEGIFGRIFNRFRNPSYYTYIFIWEPLFLIICYSWYLWGDEILSFNTSYSLMTITFILLVWPLIPLYILSYWGKSIKLLSYFQLVYTSGVFLLFHLIPGLSPVEMNWIQYIAFLNICTFTIHMFFWRILFCEKLEIVFSNTEDAEKLINKVKKFQWEMLTLFPYVGIILIEFHVKIPNIIYLITFLIFFTFGLQFFLKRQFLWSILDSRELRNKMKQCTLCNEKASFVDITCLNCYT